MTRGKRAIELTGERFGRLYVVSRASNAENSSRAVRWLCICDCGTHTIVVSQKLRSGTTKSCGCYRDELLARGNVTHGLSNTREFKTWEYMKRRIHIHESYRERGMDQSWKNNFKLFYDYVMLTIGPHPGNGYTIERVDNERGYFPGNIRWATMKEQSNNRRKRSS